MTTKYYALLTNLGASKLANAAALGTQLQITQMAVGDGGGTLPTPNATQTKLVGEKRRAALNSLSIDTANSSQIIAEQVIPETEGGFWIREIGLLDADGVLIAVANCAETYKPQLQEGSGRTQTVRMILIVSSTDAVTLKIDPSIVLATRQYVDNAVIEVKAYADDLMAKHVAAADPHTQYAPKASPTLTGSPKAPTPAASKNDTQIATTAFVQSVMKAHTDNTDPHSQYLLKEKRSSATDSTSEDTVATSKAVKDVKDSSLSIKGAVTAGVDVNNFGPVDDYLGLWYFSSVTPTTASKNLPESTVGILEVFKGGSWGCTQRYTTRFGAMYVRSLSAQWNASAPVWEAWSAIGEQPIQGYINDANAALTPGTYSVTGAASNMPMVSSPTGILEVKLRLSSNSLLQRFTSITTSSATINRSWQRTLSGTTWSPWTQTTLRPNELTTQTDANTLTESGVYYGNYTNGPSGSAYGFLEVKATGTTGVISQVYHSTTANQRFIRTCTSANGWSVWVELVRADSVMNNLVPVGVPMPWPAEAAPSGWLKCNGASFSATTYPELAKAYPSLKLPDLRGEFIRGWDDGRGIDTGRAILSLQTDALQRITGTLEMGNGIGLMTSPHASTNGAFTEGPSREQTPVTQQKGGFAVTFDSANVVRSATETRPRNVAFNYIVRAA